MARPILLVEDSEDDVFLVQNAMRKAGVHQRLEVAQDGKIAMEYLIKAFEDKSSANNVPALILLDLKMPRVPGLEFLAWLKQQPVMRLIPVVVLTSSMADKDVEAAYSLGANSYFTKPSESSQLVELMTLFETYWFKRCLPPPLCNTLG